MIAARSTDAPGEARPGWELAVVLAAVLVAVFSARDHAGSWNDGSRLATIESLVDRHTLAIERSIFVEVPDPAASPYSPDDLLLRKGTADKLLIQGHYYSDKSPVPALLLAGVYQGLQTCCGMTARAQPDRFCHAMTLAGAGLPYVVAVWCCFRLGRPLRLSLALRLTLTASFALATVALPYAQHVNNHIMLLGVASTLMLGLAWLAQDARDGRVSWPLLLGLGTLTGLGYTIDLGAGPVLVVCAASLVAYRCGPVWPVAVFALAALPWLVLHHAVNFAVGGTFKPANAVPEYFLWPGSPFNAQNLTGGWNHGSVGHCLAYLADLLVGNRGFLGHNLPLFLALPGLCYLLRRRPADRPEVLFAACWCGGTWLAYGLTSNNHSGVCCSIRWFVPLLAPAYYVLALFLREQPRYRADLLLLSGWGTVLAVLMAWHGPWMRHMVPGFWPIQAAAFMTWLLYARRRRRLEQSQKSAADEEAETLPSAA
jgi:hypothetical protein